MTAAPPPPAPMLTGAEVRQASEGVVARLTFDAPLPAGASQRVCVTFRAGRICLHGQGARVARRRHGAWVVVGRIRVRACRKRRGHARGRARLGVPFGRMVAGRPARDAQQLAAGRCARGASACAPPATR